MVDLRDLVRPSENGYCEQRLYTYTMIIHTYIFFQVINLLNACCFHNFFGQPVVLI